MAESDGSPLKIFFCSFADTLLLFYVFSCFIPLAKRIFAIRFATCLIQLNSLSKIKQRLHFFPRTNRNPQIIVNAGFLKVTHIDVAFPECLENLPYRYAFVRCENKVRFRIFERKSQLFQLFLRPLSRFHHFFTVLRKYSTSRIAAAPAAIVV